MTWLIAALLAVASFVAIALMLKAPRGGWEAIAAALVFGIAGYALQATPSLPGAPKAPAQEITANPASLVNARRALEGKSGPAGDNWLVIGDALARNGQYADAAGVMLGAVKSDAGNSEAWLALANALVAHADGMLTPASMFAFQRASEAAPADPGPPFFMGLSLAQSGRFSEARGLWGELLARSPKDAPWRADLESRLARLDGLIAQQQATAPQ